MSAIDPCRCPLCGNENNCDVARGRGSCWCFSKPIPDGVLEKIPAEARDVACVCERCAFADRSPTVTIAKARDILRRRNQG